MSADVYAVQGDTAWWIFDVGACDEAVDFINGLDGVEDGSTPLQKNIVISHFHRDHAFNLPRVHFDHLYVGRETYRHCGADIRCREGVFVVESPLLLEDGLRIRVEPIPSSHAKGSLILQVDSESEAQSVAFLGDSTYPTVGHDKPDSYNVQLLYQQIQFLRNSSAQKFYMSHRRFAPQEKGTILQLLEGYYSRREPNKNLIEL